jgi:hypothetical protein
VVTRYSPAASGFYPKDTPWRQMIAKKSAENAAMIRPQIRDDAAPANNSAPSAQKQTDDSHPIGSIPHAGRPQAYKPKSGSWGLHVRAESGEQ